jgi:amino acid transporter
MLHWIESQSILVITLVVFTFCYALAIVILGLALILARRPIAKQLKASSPVTLTPLAVILALLLAFLSSRVWTNLDRASEHAGREATALREALLLSNTLPSDVRANVHGAIKRHLHFVIAEDWPAMARVEANLRAIPAGLRDGISALLSFVPAQPTEQLAQQRTLVALEQALESRRNRILISQLEISAIQWIVIVVLTILILVTIAMIHIDNREAMVATMFIFSTAVAVCLTLLMAYDRPFASGGVTMQPTLFQETVVD